MTDILIADDHPVVSAGIRQIVSEVLPDSHVSVASTVDGALEEINKGCIGILIADLELGSESGLHLICKIHDIQPDIRVLVYTMHEEVWVVRQVMDVDPDAVVLKSDEPEELCMALRMLNDGKGYYSTTFNRLLNSLSSSPTLLSNREMEIVVLTADGMSSAAISRKLEISVNTVEFHRRRIMQKLCAANAAEMVSKARDLGLFSLEKRK